MALCRVGGDLGLLEVPSAARLWALPQRVLLLAVAGPGKRRRSRSWKGSWLAAQLLLLLLPPCLPSPPSGSWHRKDGSKAPHAAGSTSLFLPNDLTRGVTRLFRMFPVPFIALYKSRRIPIHPSREPSFISCCALLARRWMFPIQPVI